MASLICPHGRAAQTLPPEPPDEVLACLAPALHQPVQAAWQALAGAVEEIRLAVGRPLCLVGPAGDCFVDAGGRPVGVAAAYYVTAADLQRSFQLVARGSVYAWEEELRGGFLTLAGGHRVGLCGRAVVEGGRLATLHPVASLNVRIARDVPGAAAPLLPHLLAPGADGPRPCSALLLSPPRGGKTTVLRDLVRQISTGNPALNLAGRRVAVVDERSEIAGCAQGVPQRPLGPRTDVLDACPKAQGMMLLIRAMAPEVLAVDEIGRDEDAAAVLDALHAGVSVIATAHARDLAEARRRPALRRLLRAGAFARAAVLGRRPHPGYPCQVWDLGAGARLLWGEPG